MDAAEWDERTVGKSVNAMFFVVMIEPYDFHPSTLSSACCIKCRVMTVTWLSHCRRFSMLMSVASSLLLLSCLGHYPVFSESSESFCVF